MPATPPFTHDNKLVRNAPRPRLNRPVEIRVCGRRDPRGPDNSVFIWLDEDDKLHITVYKTKRCYSFERVDETAGYVDLVAK